MSRHEGVSCDACLKGNFRGRRYKCLICYDYDLCAACYEEGATSTSHSVEHPMQCILTRADFEIYYGGEPSNGEQPQSFTCPYCKKMGFSDTSLYDHVSAEHTDTGLEVVCPICAALPGGDPNLVTDDFAGHLTLEHRSGRDLISFLDEPSAIRHGGVRRMPHSGRALGGTRPRRSNMHLSSSSGLSALSPSGRESVDPIAELLSQLSGVRRGNPPPSQLQQLQMQIQLERQQVSAARQQLERLPRRPQPVSNASNALNGAIGSTSSGGIGSLQQNSSSSSTVQLQPPLLLAAAAAAAASNSAGPSGVSIGSGAQNSSGNPSNNQLNQYLLTQFMHPVLDESDVADLERNCHHRSQFVQNLLLATLTSDFRLEDVLDDGRKKVGGSHDTHNGNDSNINDNTTTQAVSGSITSAQQQQHHQQQQQQHQQQQQQNQSNNSDDSKKKPESASHSEFDSLPNQHMSPPQPQQRSSSKPKTGSSKSNQSSAGNQPSAKSPREKPVSMPSDTR